MDDSTTKRDNTRKRKRSHTKFDSSIYKKPKRIEPNDDELVMYVIFFGKEINSLDHWLIISHY